jgi:hypothetical protein
MKKVIAPVDNSENLDAVTFALGKETYPIFSISVLWFKHTCAKLVKKYSLVVIILLLMSVAISCTKKYFLSLPDNIEDTPSG